MSKGHTPESLAGVRVVAHAAPQLAFKHISAVTNEAGHLLLGSDELGIQALPCGTRVTLHQNAKGVKTLEIRSCSCLWHQTNPVSRLCTAGYMLSDNRQEHITVWLTT